MKTLKHYMFAAVLWVFTTTLTAPASAEEMDLASRAPAKKMSKSEQIRAYAQNCFDQEMSLFESTKGRLPTDEEADFIIDACANPKLK